MRFETAVTELEAKYPDIRKHAAAIKNEYLKKRYQPKDFSNPDFIVDGLYWARGKAGTQAPQVASTKKNVRVVMPASANKNGKPVGSLKPLSPFQKQMINDGTFKDEKELRAWEKADLSRV
jgi:hypothetical protein